MDAVDLTKKLLALPTVSGKLLQWNDKEVLHALLEQSGYEVLPLERAGDASHYDSYHFLATKGDAPIHLAFLSHYDVLPAGEGWVSYPYLPREENGTLFGRGVGVKAGLAAQLLAADELAEKGLRVSLFISGDALTTSLGMLELLQKNAVPIDYALGGEPTSREKSGDTIIVGRRGVIQGDITLAGKAGHAADTLAEDNVNHQLWKVLRILSPTFYGETEDFAASEFHLTGITSGGKAYDQVPASATVHFDARLSPRLSNAEFISLLEKKVQHAAQKKFPATVTLTKNISYYHTRDQPYCSLIAEAVTEILGEAPAFSTAGEMSEARHFAEQHIPVVEIGVPARDLYGAEEHVAIAEIRRLQECYTHIGEKLLKCKQKELPEPTL